MLEFIKSLSEILGMIGDFIINLVKTLLMLITAIPKALLFITSAVASLPPFVLSVVLVSIAVCIAVTILNGGKQ